MVYAPHRRLTCIGTLGDAGEEAFSFGVSMDESLFSAADDAVVFADIVAETKAFFGRAGTGISSRAVLQTIKLAKIGADGKYTADPFIDETPAVNGADITGNFHPFQCSLAVSLGSARRGPTGKGRFYLPMPAAAILGDGTVSATYATGVRDSVKTWIEALNDRPAIDGPQLSVVIPSSKGYLSGVNSVRVGRVVDTIRTRRRALAEQYTAAVSIT